MNQQPRKGLAVKNKGQTSLDFLMTYGWSLLLVVAVVSSLFALGVFNVGSFIGPRATGFSQVGIVDWNINAAGVLALRLQNYAGMDVTITSVEATHGPSVYLYDITNVSIPNSKTSDTFTVGAISSLVSGQYYTLPLKITYIDFDGFNYTEVGTISGTVGAGVVPPLLMINSPHSNALLTNRTINISVSVWGANLTYTDIMAIDSSGTPVNVTTNAQLGTYSVLLDVQTDGIYNITAMAHYSDGGSVSATARNITVNTTGQQPQLQCPSGMVSYWKAENNADDALGINNATLEGGATFAAGKVGQSFSLDGSSGYVSAGSFDGYPSGDAPGSEFAWIKTTSGAEQSIFSYGKWSAQYGHRALWLNYAGYSIYFTSDGNDVGVSGLTLTDGNWHHVGYVYAGNRDLTIYADGVAYPLTLNSPLYTELEIDNYIGVCYGGAYFPFDGLIDEVAIYNRSLTAGEIQQLYDRSNGGQGYCNVSANLSCVQPPSGLVAWWPGDDNASDVIGGNDGTWDGNEAYASGEVDRAFSFDSQNSYINTSGSLVSQQMTLSMWVYENTRAYGGGDPGRAHMLYRINDGSSEFSSDGGILSYYAVGSGGWTSTGVELPLQSWTHLTFVIDGGNYLKVYKNGAEVYSTSNSGFDNEILFMGIGYAMPYQEGYFDGLIDEVQLYNRSLSQSEIQAIYDAGSGGACRPEAPSTPILDWPMFHHDLGHTGHANSTGPMTNNLLWSRALGGPVYYSSPAVADGAVYVGSTDNSLYSINANDGSPIWDTNLGSEVLSSPAVVDGAVYVGSTGYVHALNATDGSVIWSYSIGGGSYNGLYGSSPAVAGGMVYFGSTDSNVYALNVTDGSVVWSHSTGGAMMLSSPAVADGVVYIGSGDNKVYALDATDGSFIWDYTTGASVDASSPAVVDGVVYIGSSDHNVYALDATDGSLIWNYATSDWILPSPAVAGGKVYIGSFDGKVYAIDASDGSLVWTYQTGSYIYSSPAVAGDIVYIGSYDQNVYALNSTDGSFIWSYQTGAAVPCSPAVVDGVVYVGSYDGNVYAFGAAPPIELSDCGNISYSSNYVLTGDVSNSGTCFTIEADNVTLDCAGHSITGGGSSNGVDNNGNDNVTVKNCNIMSFYRGIYFEGAYYGIIINNTVRLSADTGIVLWSSSNNTVVDNTANNNAYGIQPALDANYNIIANNTVSSNTGIGIYLDTTCNYNIIANNTVTNNSLTGQGIHLWSSSSNMIYNNFFNNTINSFVGGTVYTNYWNTTLDCGPGVTNIIGGNCTGGNFWAQPDGFGFSENCSTNGSSNSSGICTVPYGIDGSNIDELPLTMNFTANLSCVQPPSGLVGWWPGDDNTTDMISGVDGTPSGGVTYGSGKVGRAFSLDGSSYVMAPNSDSLNITGDITLGAWIRPSTLSGPQNIISKLNNEGYRWRIEDSYGNQTLILWTDIGLQVFQSASTVQPNVWQHVATTVNFSSHEVRFYLNGALTDTLTISASSISPNNYWLAIGSAGGSTNNVEDFNGLIDEPQVYDRALSASEVQAIYDAGSAGVCKTPSMPGPTELSGCGNISYSGDYILAGDVSGGGTCFMIDADNVTLDCNGSTITGTGSGTGIYNNGYDNVTVENCIVTGFSINIDFRGGASNGTIENNTASSGDYGILLYDGSDYNLVVNNTLSSNWNGIVIFSGSNNNIIANNTVLSTNGRDVYFDVGQSFGNLFYNNFFNSTYLGGCPGPVGVCNAAVGSSNFWNTTLDCGTTNVVGGPCIGGNFWADATGTGWSETPSDCNANSSGICTVPYGIDGSNVDELPLTNPPAQPQCVQPPSDLVSWWPGDDNTTDIVGVNDGAWNGAYAYAPGEVGQAFSFDGSNYVNVPGPASGSAFTMGAWVKTTDGGVGKGIVASDLDCNRLIWLYENGATGPGVPSFDPGGFWLDADVPVNDGQWHYVAGTSDGTTVSIYVDGVLRNSMLATALSSSSPLDIGGGGCVQGNLVGDIDEVQFYGRALSASEIQAIYGAGSGGVCRPHAVDNNVWVANNGDGTVSRIDGNTGSVIGSPIAVGSQPWGVAVDPDYAWIANAGSSYISKINKSTGDVTNIPTDYPMSAIAVDDRYVWFGGWSNGILYKLDKSSGLITSVITVGGIEGLAVDNDYVWVSDWGYGGVDKINKSSGQLMGTMTVGTPNPYGITVDNESVWSVDWGANMISRIDTTTDAVTNIGGMGSWPQTDAVDDRYVWVANRYDTTITKVDKSTNSAVGTITTGSQVWGVAVDNRFVWATNWNDGTVSKIDKSTDTVVGSPITVGTNPIIFGDGTGYAYDMLFH